MLIFQLVRNRAGWIASIMHTACIKTHTFAHRCPGTSNEIMSSYTCNDQIDAAREWDADRGPETEMQQIGTVTVSSLSIWFPQRWHHDVPAGAMCAVPVVYLIGQRRELAKEFEKRLFSRILHHARERGQFLRTQRYLP